MFEACAEAEHDDRGRLVLLWLFICFTPSESLQRFGFQAFFPFCTNLRRLRFVCAAMVKHLTPAERDQVRQLGAKGLEAKKIQTKINARRNIRHVEEIGVDAVLRAMSGKTHLQGRRETRGRKRLFNKRTVLKMNRVRKNLIKEAGGEYEVTWKDILKKARVRRGHRSTAKRAFAREKIPVALRRPREKPQRGPEQEAARMEACRKMRYLPNDYFLNTVDLIMDNKKWEIPTHARARTYVKKTRVRGHLRTPGEGLKSGFTKPNTKKQRMHTGGYASVCAGISHNKVVLWEYLGKRWTGQAASDLYRGPILKAMQKARGEKDKYLICEDNDRTGYNSKLGLAAKKDIGARTVPMPKYSPDLNPLDFYVWSEVGRRMAKAKVKQPESAKAYKARLRRTALNLPRDAVGRAVLCMKKRMAAVFEAKGGDIARD